MRCVSFERATRDRKLVSSLRRVKAKQIYSEIHLVQLMTHCTSYVSSNEYGRSEKAADVRLYPRICLKLLRKKAETGVGAAIAACSQEENGIRALVVTATKQIN